ncbi:MAG: undecaprenyl-diphosphate phosphatase [Porticoccaceae bacterium]
MDFIQAFWLAVVQGLTEFLPISSSAHLILPSAILGWQDQGLAFDVAVHVGSLIAVLAYFKNDVTQLIQSWVGSTFLGRDTNAESQMAWFIILATLPAALVGLLAGGFIELHLRSIAVIAATTIVFGLLLGWVDWRVRGTKSLQSLTCKSALIIGLAQVLALIPGTSRSGITITAALALGFDRNSAARFSFLLAIPIITLSGGYQTLQLLAESSVPWFEIAFATVVSGITAYLCIHYFLRLVDKIGMLPFVIYRLLLGVVLILIYNGVI